VFAVAVMTVMKLVFILLLTYLSATSAGYNISATSIPTYCIDDKVQQIFRNRIDRCLGSRSPSEELNFLLLSSVADYQASQELVAFEYFTDKNNPFRRPCGEGADLEYIPLLPLSWKVGFPTRTSCTAGGRCPRHQLSDPLCDIKHLVDDILQYVKYAKMRPLASKSVSIPFVVTGALNVKTVLGHGMPTQNRRGSAWNDVMWFVEHTFLGHYERLPQCADLLRKPWRYIAEIPYVPVVPPTHSLQAIPLNEKDLDFVFIGRVHLWSVQRACAVRPWLVRELSSRPRTALIDLAEDLTYGPPLQDEFAHNAMRRSRFCLVARADSYSTASFYNAIQAGCIPVVVSDWFVFSFWWDIPYDSFVVRISEEVFLSNPNEVLDRLLAQFSDEKVAAMQQEMLKWSPSLRYDGMKSGTPGRVTPLNLLMVEVKAAALELLRVVQEKTNEASNMLVCFDPVLCASRQGGKPISLAGPKIKSIFPYLCQNAGRLLGRYKIVYFQKCVKLLWPLRPGNILKQDRKRGISAEEEQFVRVFHNISGAAASSPPWRVYPPLPDISGSNIYHPVA